MNPGRHLWLTLVVMAVVTVTVPPRALALQNADDPAAVAARDLERLAATLGDPQAPREQREEAAKRLVSRRSPEARKILADALINPNPAGQLAAARALADDPQPDPALINPLFAALVEGNRSFALTQAAARALTNYRGSAEVLTRLISAVERRPPYPETVRREIIRAMGTIIEKRSAQLLISLLRDQAESPAIRAAAADALIELTGLTQNDRSVEQWSNWWSDNSRRSEAEFRNDYLPRRASSYDQLRLRYNEVNAQLQNYLTRTYQMATGNTQREILLGYLRESSPEVRAIGATIVREDALGNKPIPPQVRDQLRVMIGDSDPQVRAAVANALSRINDAASLQPLLAQLAQETDGNVRAALAEALGPINDLQAVPALLKLLNDPFSEAAAKAAGAIRLLGQKIATENPALAATTANALRDALQRRPAGFGNSEVREAIVDAMAQVRQESLLQDALYPLLAVSARESAEVKRLALRAIGNIGNEQSVGIISSAFDDRDKTVRLEAVKAMGQMPNAASYVESIWNRLGTAKEDDESVRQEAWLVLQSILPRLTLEQLTDYAHRLRNDPKRQFMVQKALEDKLKLARNEDDLADLRHNIGMTLMRPEHADYKSAAEYFRLSLDHRKNRPNVRPIDVATLRDALMRALLASKQYPEAASFATESIREDTNIIPTMGAALRSEAERLLQEGDLDNAMKLIEATKTMTTPLADLHKDQLLEIESNIRKRLSQRGHQSPGLAPFEPATEIFAV